MDWEKDVVDSFPSFSMEQIPRRWHGHNEALGKWLIELRSELVAGNELNFGVALPQGVKFIEKTKAGIELAKEARDIARPGESVVVITAPHPPSVRAAAARLRGYSAMEEMAGNFMAEKLLELSELEPAAFASWTGQLVKLCFSGHSGIDKAVLKKLSNGQETSKLKRPGLEITLSALDKISHQPSLQTVAAAMTEIRAAQELGLHSREAWRDMTAVIEICASDPAKELLVELIGVRSRIRHGGRRNQLRVVSRTVLVKGLEYDHVIIADLARISDANNLYVALTRARKSITIIGSTPKLIVKKTKTGRAA